MNADRTDKYKGWVMNRGRRRGDDTCANGITKTKKGVRDKNIKGIVP
jgi:hypothetical protein